MSKFEYRIVERIRRNGEKLYMIQYKHGDFTDEWEDYYYENISSLDEVIARKEALVSYELKKYQEEIIFEKVI